MSLADGQHGARTSLVAGGGRGRFSRAIPTVIVACDALAGVSAGLDGNSGALRFWGVAMIVATYTYEFRWGKRGAP